MVKYQHYTAETLTLEKWGDYKLDIIQDNNCKYIVCKSNYYKSKLISEVYLYDNYNILIKSAVQQGITLPKCELLCKYRMMSKSYDYISVEVFDDKFRIARSSDGITIIREDNAKSVFEREKKWKGIKGVYDGYAVVNSKDIYYNLTQLNLNNAYSNLLQGSYEITYIKDGLFKYRDHESGGLFFLYNARNHKKSNNKLISYDDILVISDQLAMGVKYNTQWDFINVHTLDVKYTSIEEPKWNKDTLELVGIDKYGRVYPYTINKWGTKLSEEPKEEIAEPVVKVKEEIQPLESGPVEEISVIQDESITIGKFIVVTDNSARKSENGDYVFLTYSYKKACKCEGYPCWILIKQKLIIITERESKRNNTLKCKLIGTLPDEFEEFNCVSDNKKWQYFDQSVSASKTEIVNEAINVIAPTLRKLSSKRKELIEEQQKRDVEDTKDILRLKAIYDFLKLQGFDKNSTSDAISSLFPEIEEYIDYTNVKQTYYYGWKRYVENVEKLKKITPNGYIDESMVVGELNFSDKEKMIFDYYTNVKEYPIEVAIDCIQEESPTGVELIKEYETLMRLDDTVENQRKMLQREIIDDLINNFTVMADTSQMLQLPKSSTTKTVDNDFFTDTTKSTDFTIKGVKRVFKLNESVGYDIFENKKFHLYHRPISYLQYGKDVVLLLNIDKAKEFDSEHSRQILIRGNGEDKKFDQDYTYVNGIISKQRDNGTRIYVFECIDDTTCRFFDELQCIKHELVEDENEGRKVIYFTMKSLLRYNTD